MEKRRINGVFFDLGWTLERPADDDWVLTRCFFEHVKRDDYYAMDEALRTSAIHRAMEPLETHHHILTMEEENIRFTGFYSDLNRYLSLGLSEEAVRTIAADHTYNFENYVVFDSTAKPHPRMYEDALEKMGLPAEETVYIDDLTMSLNAAKAYGINGVCSIAKPGAEPVPDYPCIQQPDGLLEVLKEMNGGSL